MKEKIRIPKYIYIIVIIYSIIFFSFAAIRHNNLQSNWDVGISEEYVWNTINGKFFFSDDLELNYLGNHFHPIQILMLPAYYLFPETETMFLLQTLALTLSSLIIYHISQKKLENKTVSSIITITYLIHPTIMLSLILDLHFMFYSIPLILLAIYFAEENKWTYYWIFLVASILVVEYISIVTLFMGIYIFISKNKKQGLRTIIVSILAFIIIIQVIMPTLNPSSKYTHLDRYNYLGNNIKEIATNLMLHPIYEFNKVFTYNNFENSRYILLMLGFNLFLPLGSLLSIITIPIISINILSLNYSQNCYSFYYSLIIVSIFFYATIKSLEKIKRKNIHLFKKMIVAFLIISIILSIKFGFVPLINGETKSPIIENKCFNNHFSIINLINKVKSHDSIKYGSEIKEQISQIPENESVLSTFHIYSQTTHKNESRNLRNQFFSLKRQCIVENYFLYDHTDSFSPFKKNFTDIKQYFKDNNYNIIWEKGEVVIFKKEHYNRECLNIIPLTK